MKSNEELFQGFLQETLPYELRTFGEIRDWSNRPPMVFNVDKFNSVVFIDANFDDEEVKIIKDTLQLTWDYLGVDSTARNTDEKFVVGFKRKIIKHIPGYSTHLSHVGGQVGGNWAICLIGKKDTRVLQHETIHIAEEMAGLAPETSSPSQKHHGYMANKTGADFLKDQYDLLLDEKRHYSTHQSEKLVNDIFGTHIFPNSNEATVLSFAQGLGENWARWLKYFTKTHKHLVTTKQCIREANRFITEEITPEYQMLVRQTMKKEWAKI